jgi:hypothetical protein
MTVEAQQKLSVFGTSLPTLKDFIDWRGSRSLRKVAYNTTESTGHMHFPSPSPKGCVTIYSDVYPQEKIKHSHILRTTGHGVWVDTGIWDVNTVITATYESGDMCGLGNKWVQAEIWFIMDLLSIIFFCSARVWTQGLHLEPLHQLFFVMVFGFFCFVIGSHKLCTLAGFDPQVSWSLLLSS